jgi:hypothetical protein
MIPGNLLYVSASAAHIPGTNATWSVTYADSEAPGAAGIEYNPGR